MNHEEHSIKKQPEDLRDRTFRFALTVIKFVRSLPNDMVAREIGRQLLRSGTSVAANTRAAYRGRSTKEFVAKVGIVIEEADESLFWLELLLASNTVHKERLTLLLNEANELVSIFVTVKKNTLKGNQGK